MQTVKEYTESYLSALLKKRDFILSTMEKYPIEGINIANLSREEKVLRGGIRKMSYDIDAEILAVYQFVLFLPEKITIDNDIELNIKEIEKHQVKLINFSEKGDVTVTPDILKKLEEIKAKGL